MRARARALLRPEDPDRRLEFVRGYATPLALVVIGDIIGVPEEDFPLLQEAIPGAIRSHSGAYGDEEFRTLARRSAAILGVPPGARRGAPP